jgi:hypothetical protein
MLLDYVVCVVVSNTNPSFIYFLKTTLTTLPLGKQHILAAWDYVLYFSPRRVAVLLPHEMLLD